MSDAEKKARILMKLNWYSEQMEAEHRVWLSLAKGDFDKLPPINPDTITIKKPDSYK